MGTWPYALFILNCKVCRHQFEPKLRNQLLWNFSVLLQLPPRLSFPTSSAMAWSSTTRLSTLSILRKCFPPKKGEHSKTTAWTAWALSTETLLKLATRLFSTTSTAKTTRQASSPFRQNPPAKGRKLGRSIWPTNHSLLENQFLSTRVRKSNQPFVTHFSGLRATWRRRESRLVFVERKQNEQRCYQLAKEGFLGSWNQGRKYLQKP